MRVQSPVLALVGLLALGVVALDLLQGGLTVAQAGTRAAVVLGVLVVVDRLVLPLARMLVGAPARAEQGESRTPGD